MTLSPLLYTLTFESPVGIFTGLGVAGLTDRTVVRRGSGLPFVPGSTVKGRLRFFAQRLLAAGGAPEAFRAHDPAGPACKERSSACTVCRLFGSSSVPGALRVGDAEPEEATAELLLALRRAAANPVVSPDAEIRPMVAISRLRRTALQDHLAFDETVGPIRFRGEILLASPLRPHEVGFLRAVGRTVDALGGRKAAGRGRLTGGIVIGDEEASGAGAGGGGGA